MAAAGVRGGDGSTGNDGESADGNSVHEPGVVGEKGDYEIDSSHHLKNSEVETEGGEVAKTGSNNNNKRGNNRFSSSFSNLPDAGDPDSGAACNSRRNVGGEGTDLASGTANSAGKRLLLQKGTSEELELEQGLLPHGRSGEQQRQHISIRGAGEASRSAAALLEVPNNFWSRVEDQVRFIDSSTCDSLNRDDASQHGGSRANVRGSSLPLCCQADVVTASSDGDGDVPGAVAGSKNNNKCRSSASPSPAAWWVNRRGRSWNSRRRNAEKNKRDGSRRRRETSSTTSPLGVDSSVSAGATSEFTRRKSHFDPNARKSCRRKTHARSLSDCRRPTDLMLADIAKSGDVGEPYAAVKDPADRRAAATAVALDDVRFLRFKSASVDKLLIDRSDLSFHSRYYYRRRRRGSGAGGGGGKRRRSAATDEDGDDEDDEDERLVYAVARREFQVMERRRGNSWAADHLHWTKTNAAATRSRTRGGHSSGAGTCCDVAGGGADPSLLLLGGGGSGAGCGAPPGDGHSAQYHHHHHHDHHEHHHHHCQHPDAVGRRDLRYYFQHPYPRLFVAYLVIFCNFLLFAEDPISHSHTESNIPVVGNVFSFVLTKYPPEWTWSLGKVLMWIFAIGCGLIFGKVCIHRFVCGKILRLQMFRDEQGSWMVMWLSVIVSLYLFSHLYNFVLLLGCPEYLRYKIDAWMGVSNSSIMKAAACGTWLGDLFTAWFVTDMMLQDNLYSSWAPRLRHFWRTHDVVRIVLFWFGSVSATTIVVTFIVFDVISWDSWNQGFVATTELSRAFLASFILVMDLIILMQDWDFPHFSNPLAVNLSGFRVASLNFRFFQIRITGKWFNYGVILVVMILDLNMWKNQFFYQPQDYGQYVDAESYIHTVMDESILEKVNRTLWTWEARSRIDVNTSKPYFEADERMNSKFIGYTIGEKSTAFIPSIFAFSMFFVLISLYGRFPATEKLFGFPTRLMNNREHFKLGKKLGLAKKYDRYEMAELGQAETKPGDASKPAANVQRAAGEAAAPLLDPGSLTNNATDV